MQRDCDACQGIEPVTPQTVANRPGLPALRYRTGTHGSFLESMIAKLSVFGAEKAKEEAARQPDRSPGQPPLPPSKWLRSREPADPTIALLDAWATVGDILTFYQERIANEGYLTTALERRSLHELANLVGYKLRPALSSSVYLAFDVQPPPALDREVPPAPPHEVLIPKGTQARHIPGPGELPQVFETKEDLVARPEWNQLKPRMTKPTVIDAGTALELQKFWIKGANQLMRPNDMLLFVFSEDLSTSVARFVSDTGPQNKSVDQCIPEDRTRIDLQESQFGKKRLIELIGIALVRYVKALKDIHPQIEAKLSSGNRSGTISTTFQALLTLSQDLAKPVATPEDRAKLSVRQAYDDLFSQSRVFNEKVTAATDVPPLTAIHNEIENHRQPLDTFLTSASTIRARLDTDPKSVLNQAKKLFVVLGKANALVKAPTPTAQRVTDLKSSLTAFIGVATGTAKVQANTLNESLDSQSPSKAVTTANALFTGSGGSGNDPETLVNFLQQMAVVGAGTDVTPEVADNVDRFVTRLSRIKEFSIGSTVVNIWATEMITAIGDLRDNPIYSFSLIKSMSTAAIATGANLQDLNDTLSQTSTMTLHLAAINRLLNSTQVGSTQKFQYQELMGVLNNIHAESDRLMADLNTAVVDLTDTVSTQLRSIYDVQKSRIIAENQLDAENLITSLGKVIAATDDANAAISLTLPGHFPDNSASDKAGIAKFSAKSTQKCVTMIECVIRIGIGLNLDLFKVKLDPPLPSGGSLTGVGALSANYPSDPGIKVIAERWSDVILSLDRAAASPNSQQPAGGASPGVLRIGDISRLFGLTDSINGGIEVDNILNAQSDLLSQIQNTLNPEGIVSYDLVRTAQRTVPPELKTLWFRGRHALFGHNAMAPGNQGKNSDKENAEVNSNTVDSLRSELEGDVKEEERRVMLDGEVTGIVAGSVIVISTPQDRSNTGLIRRTVLNVSVVERSAYGLSGKCTVLDVDLGWWSPHSDISAIRTAVVYSTPEEIIPTEEPIIDKFPDKDGSFELTGIVDGMRIDQPLMISGTQVVDLEKLLAGTKGVVSEVSRVVFTKIGGVQFHPGINKRYTEITIQGQISARFRRDTVRIYANVVEATNGSTVTEVIGNGEGQGQFQRFLLSQPRLTYLPAETPTGMKPELEVRVNSVEWNQAESVGDLQPVLVPGRVVDGEPQRMGLPRKYLTSVDDDQKTFLTTGDGVTTGERLPTGITNVRATYRVGGGKSGNVKEGTITQLASPPLNVTKVRNLMPASGGVDRENVDQARKNLPVAVMALDRLVSVTDYESFARKFAGIAKAQATLLSLDGRDTVVVTIAALDDQTIDKQSLLYKNLEKALRKFADPEQSVIVEPRELMLLMTKARIKVEDGYRFEDVKVWVRERILKRFDFEKAQLGDSVLLSDLIETIQNTRGVRYVDVNMFDRMRQFYGTAQMVAYATAIKQGVERKFNDHRPEDQFKQPRKLIRLEPARKQDCEVLYLPDSNAPEDLSKETESHVVVPQSDNDSVFPAQLAYFTDLAGTILLEEIK